MEFRIAGALLGSARRVPDALMASGIAALIFTSAASAQQTQPAPATPPAQRPPVAAPPRPPAAAQPAQPTPPAARPGQPAAPAQPGQPAQRPGQPPAAGTPGAPAVPQSAETPPLIYSPWTKVCGKEGPQGAAQKEVCFTIKEARLDSGQFVASAGLIEMEGEQKKILRVTLPLGLLLRQGTRMIVDTQQPITGTYNFCLPNGCWADFEVNPEFVGRLKKGQSLVLQAFNLNGQVASFAFPLPDFAKSNEGPATDPKVLEEQQKKLQEELQRRADDARKRLEQQGGQPAPTPAPAR